MEPILCKTFDQLFHRKLFLDFPMLLKTLWFVAVAVLVVLFTGGFSEATGRCGEQESINFKAITGHTFRKLLHVTGNPYQCHLKCKDDIRCQSFNFVIGIGRCELNNQTKETRPKDFIDDNERFYMKRWPKGGE